MEEDKRLWVDDQYAIRCCGCNKKFTILRRRHHCRQCGQIFCSSCLLSTTSTIIPYSDIVNEITKVVSKWTFAGEKEANTQSIQNESHELEKQVTEQPLPNINEYRLHNQLLSTSSLESSHLKEYEDIPLTTLSTSSPHYSSYSSSLSSTSSSSSSLLRNSIALCSHSPLSLCEHNTYNSNTTTPSQRKQSTSSTTTVVSVNKGNDNIEKNTNECSNTVNKWLHSSNIKVCRRCAQSLLAARDRQRSFQQETSQMSTYDNKSRMNKWQRWHANSTSIKRNGGVRANQHKISNENCYAAKEELNSSSLMESTSSFRHSTPHSTADTQIKSFSFAPVEQHRTDQYKELEESQCASLVCVFDDDSVCNITKVESNNVCQNTENAATKQEAENEKISEEKINIEKAFIYQQESEEERRISYSIADARMFVLPFMHHHHHHHHYQEQETYKQCNVVVTNKSRYVDNSQTKKEIDACITANVQEQEELECTNYSHLACIYLSAAYLTWVCNKPQTISENAKKVESLVDGSSNKNRNVTDNDICVDEEKENANFTTEKPNDLSINNTHQHLERFQIHHEYYFKHLHNRIRQHCNVALQSFVSLEESVYNAECEVKCSTELQQHSVQAEINETFINDIMEVACNVVKCIAVPLGSHIANHVKYLKLPANVSEQSSWSNNCRVVDGLVLCQGVASRRMPHVWHRPRILILSGEVTTLIEPAVELSEYIASYKGFLDKLYERICRWTPNIVVTERGMHHYLQECLLSNGHITLIMNVGATNVRQLAMCTDAMIISDLQYVTLEELGNEEMLGVCDVFEVCELSYEAHLCIFRGLPCPLIATIMISTDKWNYEQYKYVLECAIMDTYHLCLQFHLMYALHLLMPPCILLDNGRGNNNLHNENNNLIVEKENVSMYSKNNDRVAINLLLLRECMYSEEECDTIMFTTVYLDKLNSASDGTAYSSYLQANSNCTSLLPASSVVSALPHMNLKKHASYEFSHCNDALVQQNVLCSQKSVQVANENEKKHDEKEYEEDEPILPYMVSKQVNKLKFYTLQDESVFSFLVHQRGQRESRVLLAHDKWKIMITTSTSVEVVPEGPVKRSTIETTEKSDKSAQPSCVAHDDKETDASCNSKKFETIEDMSKMFTEQYNVLRHLTLRYYRFTVANLNASNNDHNNNSSSSSSSSNENDRQLNSKTSIKQNDKLWWQPELYQVQRLQHLVSCHVECKECKTNESNNVQNCKASSSTFWHTNINLLSPHILNLSLGAFIHFLIYGLPHFVCAGCKHKIELPFTVIFTIYTGTGSQTCTRVELAEIPRFTVVYPLSEYKKTKILMESEVCPNSDKTVCDAKQETNKYGNKEICDLTKTLVANLHALEQMMSVIELSHKHYNNSCGEVSGNTLVSSSTLVDMNESDNETIVKTPNSGKTNPANTCHEADLNDSYKNETTQNVNTLPSNTHAESELEEEIVSLSHEKTQLINKLQESIVCCEKRVNSNTSEIVTNLNNLTECINKVKTWVRHCCEQDKCCSEITTTRMVEYYNIISKITKLIKSCIEKINNEQNIKRNVNIRLHEPTSLIAAALERYYLQQEEINKEQENPHTETTTTTTATKKAFSTNEICNSSSNKEEFIENSRGCEQANKDIQQQYRKNKMELIHTLSNIEEVDCASAQNKTVSYTLRLSSKCVIDNIVISNNSNRGNNNCEREINSSFSKAVVVKVDVHLVNEFSAVQQLYCSDSSKLFKSNNDNINSDHSNSNLKRDKSTMDSVKLLIESLERCRSFKAEGGKTKAEFYVTLDKHFLLKRIKHMELRHFLRFAPRYFKYMSNVYHANEVDAQETEYWKVHKSEDDCEEERSCSALTKIIGLYTIHYQSSVRSPNAKLLDTNIVMEEPAYILSTEPEIIKQTNAVICEAVQNKDSYNRNDNNINQTQLVNVNDTNNIEEHATKNRNNIAKEIIGSSNEFVFTVNRNDNNDNCIDNSEEYNEHYHFILMQYLTTDEISKENDVQIELHMSEENKIAESAIGQTTNWITCYDLKGSQRNRTTNSTATVRQDVDLIHQLREGKFFYISLDEKCKLMNVIKRDVELLAMASVMDYSLLVIVNKNTEKINVGIIDFLHPYTSAKVIESKVKSSLDTVLRYPAHDPTIIDPVHYRQRFLRWIDGYFCEVPEYTPL